MGTLPDLPYSDGIRKYTTVQFGGLAHTRGASDGMIWWMENLSSDDYPVLSPRKPRRLSRTLTKPNGMYCRDGVYYVDGTGFYLGGVKKGDVADNRKRFCCLGAYIIILPDKAYFNTATGEFGALEASWAGSCTIRDGTYAGEAAKANTVYAAGADFTALFRPGDAVTIAGAAKHPANNQTIIVREVTATELRFYENSFSIGSDGDTETLTLSRDVPDMDFLCENENRLWGCKGDTIYASKLGDPFNWNVFDGVATDSYAVTVGSAGDFTACVSYLGYPVFFKEDMIYKVYGDRPATFQVMSSASLGVAKGSDRSLAVAGEVLYYLSRAGIVAYSGGIPSSVAAPFGELRFSDAVAGSDGVKYFVSMKSGTAWHLFVYDSQKGLWHREDGTQALDFGWDGGLYLLTAQGLLWGGTGGTEEANVASLCEFADFVEGNPNRKGTAKLQLRGELDAGASLTVAMQFDSDGVWREVSVLTASVKRSWYLPIIPRRSDHFRIRLTGTGMWRLYSLTREHYIGSEL